MDLRQQLKTTPKYIDILNTDWIHTLRDFFLYLPRNYEDRENIKTLIQIQFDDTVQSVKWKIISKNMIRTRTGKSLVEMIFLDTNWNQWQINLLNWWFTFKNTKKDHRYIIVWKPQYDKWKITFWHPEMVESEHQDETEDEENNFKAGRIYPIYSELLGISPAWFAKKMRENLSLIDTLFEETLPERILKENNLMTLKEAIRQLHFPTSFEAIGQAKYRLIFERLIKIQLVSIINKRKYQSVTIAQDWQPDREIIKDFVTRLPFTLTNAQKKSIKNIIEDFHKWKPMNRLLQWDVWSWKTMVAVVTAYYMIKKNRWQVAFLAPTEVLANQHAKSLSKFLLPAGINMYVLTGSTSAKEKEKVKTDLGSWKLEFIIWTHAILQQDIDFQNLRYAIIDEQHKFWVLQRAFFKKFNAPHILQMTATPIPRSLTLAFFGEFDVSIIDEMPAWRQPIHTKIVSENELIKMKPWILTKLNQWQNLYIVTPLIQDSEKLNEVKSAEAEYEEFCALYPELRWKVGLLHWKIKPKEKDEIMNDFKSWKLKVLISTTVIEVWIDVPHATVMIIKNSERFGLSQLHQLRWRVGRSDLKSYCFLVTKNKSAETMKRLKAMENTNDGFKLAQIDLELRGSGHILGTRQSWESDIPIEILTDTKFIESIQLTASKLLDKDPLLNTTPILKSELIAKENDLFI